MKLFETIKKNLSLNKKARHDYKAFKAIPKNKRQVVFYAETSADWSFIGPVYNELIKIKKSIVMITSDINDKKLKESNCYYIGYGSVRTIFFRTLDSKFLVLTLADIGSSYLKKSMFNVHYFYIFHSLISSHVAYKEHAFDNYSTIFCAGEYHVKEIRMTEKVYKLKNKKIEKSGYPKLDELLADYKTFKQENNKTSDFKILIAPSWGENSIKFNQLVTLIDNLIIKNYVILRLHPMTIFKDNSIVEKIKTKYNNEVKFIFDQSPESNKSFIEADCLISDWSGSAIEFAYTKLRPVIFIETKQKIRNKNWHNLDLGCFEKDIRNQIGYTLPLEKLSEINILISQMKNNLIEWEKSIYKLRDENVFNLRKSAKFIVNKIIDQINN